MNGVLSPDQWFTAAGQLAMVGWFILVFMPRRFRLLNTIPKYLIPFALGLLYSGLVLAHFFTQSGGFGSLADVRSLFANDYILLAGWVHYLAFDLFTGAWIAREADNIGVSRLIQQLLLVATFMFGPVGLVLFLLMRGFNYATTKEVAHV